MSEEFTKQQLEDLQVKLQDKWWRLNNLYKIRDKFGNLVRFQPNKYQTHFYQNLHTKNVIVKARQLGFSTMTCAVFLDEVLFNNNKAAVIITHKAESARELFRDKVKVMYNSIDPQIQQLIGKLESETTEQILFDNGSSIMVSASARSATANLLMVSELGYTSKYYPGKAAEIVSGAMNAIHFEEDQGNMLIIESTAAGSGEGNHFFRIAKTAQQLKLALKKLSVNQYKLHFYPWWVVDEYKDDSDVVINSTTMKYFDALSSKLGVVLSDAQKRWYQNKKEEGGESMFEEFPSTMQEAFNAPVQGGWYTNEMNRVFTEQRVKTLHYNDQYYVDTWWDIGYNDENTIVFTQTINGVIKVIDYYENSQHGFEHYAKVLEEKEYRYNAHHLPWDVEKHEIGSGRTLKHRLIELGLRNIRVAPQIKVTAGIEMVRKLFRRFEFDEEKCNLLVESLVAYRKAYNKKTGMFMDAPVHDIHSHRCDAIRVLGALWREGDGHVTVGEDKRKKMKVESVYG